VTSPLLSGQRRRELAEDDLGYQPIRALTPSQVRRFDEFRPAWRSCS
jgi:hypothetical protein